ncbi:MAG: hypothetical protein NTY19_07665, partial [Planctomycetota bacterium]|nr:hypothetical protein [Planctomycetota bacterium]
MSDQPSPTVSDGDGRGPGGRFVKGNKAGKGNPLAQQAQKLRGAVMRAFSAAEMRQVIKTLIGEAVKGDVAAARLLLERALGPPIAWDMEERLSR